MIAGVGTDVVAVRMFAQQFDTVGTVFANVFTGAERRTARARAVRSGGEGPHLAARWAAKEALIKAWSGALTGRPPAVAEGEVNWALIEVVSDTWDRPSLVIHRPLGRSVDRSLLEALGPGQARWHVSLSHDDDYAIATVILEWVSDGAAEPETNGGNQRRQRRAVTGT